MNNAASNRTPGADSEGPRFTEIRDWLFSVLRLGDRKAPLVTSLMIGALVIFSVSLAVLYATRAIPLWKVLLMAVAGIAIGFLALLIAKAAQRRLRLLGDAVAWLLATLFFVVLALVISGIFFGVPQAGALFLAQIIDAPGIVVQAPRSSKTINSSMPITAIDPVFRLPPDGANEVDRVAHLAKYPALHLEDAVLTAGADESLYIAANKLELSNSAIITNGASVTIEVLTLISSNARIRAFQAAAAQGNGGKGGTVRLIVHDQAAGSLLRVDLSGQAGAAGADGAAGATGGQGNPGEDAASHLADCAHGPGNGGPGLKGGKGADGKPGNEGGDGGTLILEGKIDATMIEFVDNSSVGGRGGKGGAGGSGGPGGPGGGSHGWCQGHGSQGATGPSGDSGENGANGKNGEPAKLLVKH